MKRKTEVSELIFRIVAYVFLIIFAAMCIYPLIYALAAAFSDKTSMDAGSVIILPMVGNKVGATIEAFKVAFMESQFWVNYANPGIPARSDPGTGQSPGADIRFSSVFFHNFPWYRGFHPRSRFPRPATVRW